MSIVVENSTVLSALTEKFAEVFGDTKEVEYFFSPGRINLIGEHTDYNGGYVFPSINHNWNNRTSSSERR
jgi:galactokinase